MSDERMTTVELAHMQALSEASKLHNFEGRTLQKLIKAYGALAADVPTPEERAVLEACRAMTLRKSKSTRPPFTESVKGYGGGQGVVDAEWARRAAKAELPHGIPEGENDKGWPEGTPESVTKGERNV